MFLFWSYSFFSLFFLFFFSFSLFLFFFFLSFFLYFFSHRFLFVFSPPSPIPSALSIPIDLAALVGGDTCIVGFTGATGGLSQAHDVLSLLCASGVGGDTEDDEDEELRAARLMSME